MKKSVLITGSSRGLGLALAKELESRGWNVIATSRGSGALPLDVRNLRSVKELYERLAPHLHNGLDLLINNAAVLPSRDGIGTISQDELVLALDTNALGAFRVTKMFWPLLVKARGLVINVSSTDGLTSHMNGDRAAYAVSKAALNAITKQFAILGQQNGVRVCAVNPGWMQTELGGDGALVDPVDSAQWVADITKCGQLAINGAFLNYDGKASQVL